MNIDRMEFANKFTGWVVFTLLALGVLYVAYLHNVVWIPLAIIGGLAGIVGSIVGLLWLGGWIYDKSR